MPWLKQLGIRKGGLYSYDRLENLFGLNGYSTDRILPQYQNLQPGDTLLPGPMNGPRLVAMQEIRCLIFFAEQPGGVRNLWSFHLHPQPDGSTRLLTVYRMSYAPTFLNFLIWRVFIDPLHFIMEQKMLRGIRDRAEMAAGFQPQCA